MRIAVRVDASAVIGSGHFMRCLTLVDALMTPEDQAYFLCRQLPDSLGVLLGQRGYAWIPLPRERQTPLEPDAPRHGSWLGVSLAQDAEETRAVLESVGGVDWMVVDHYALDARWERVIRPHCRFLLAIDDLADRPHDVDALLDQNYYRDVDSRYMPWLASSVQRFLGPRYALLRPDFQRLHRLVGVRDKAVKRLLVFFGSMDPDNYTGFAVETLASMSPDYAVDVVIGAAHPQRDALVSRCASLGFCCHVQTGKMAELMAAADLAVGAGGTAVWERCALGLPTLVLCIAYNQRHLIEEMRALALFSAPDIALNDNKALCTAIQALIDDRALRASFSERCLALVDGGGAERVATWMKMRASRRKATQF